MFEMEISMNNKRENSIVLKVLVIKDHLRKMQNNFYNISLIRQLECQIVNHDYRFNEIVRYNVR